MARPAIVHETLLPARESEKVWGSDPIAAMLRERQIPYISLVPGSTYRGLHDGLVNYPGNRKGTVAYTRGQGLRDRCARPAPGYDRGA